MSRWSFATSVVVVLSCACAEAPQTFAEQVAEGGELFGEHCAECHGAAGEGTEDGPALVGADALPLDPPEDRVVRTAPFRTAADVYAFASVNMPADDPGSLPADELVAILAFDLSANGVTLDEPLSLDNAADVVINPE